MIDYDGYGEYLKKIGFADSGIATYKSYIRRRILDILAKIKDYGDLSDKEKIIKFSNVDKGFKRIFDNYHEFGNDTFNDARSGARRYKYYLQYLSIMQTMNDYNIDKNEFIENGAYSYFKVFGKSYPVKAICRKNLKILGLNDDFRTHNGQTVLEKIFDQKNTNNLILFDNRINNTQDNKPTEKNSIDTKNIILYGAPGVGKTHNYQRIISMIERGIKEQEIFKAITNNKEVELDDITFQTIKADERIEFVTFHQNYSYEDFIEGFRPNEKGNIELEDGIFKSISDLANNNLKNSNLNNQENIVNIDELIQKFTNHVQDSLDNENDFYIDTKIKIDSINDKGAFLLGGSIKPNTQRLTVDIIKRDYQEYKNGNIQQYEDIEPTRESKSKFHGNARYYFMIYKVISNFENSLDSNAVRQQKEEQKNFYIVIDEINRGNISKIFGELITLIEEDKRNIYSVKLPYSKKEFKIPSNLYIIATMNSTDKSIATIDIALRRRFTFLKMKPNLELVDNTQAKELMEKLNVYIKDKLGEDYELGHSYFMKVENKEDLEFIKEYKIKPLLEEYFYADDIKLNEVLELLK